MINVNKVYRSVLSIVNKEQRGYITPDQFNKIARQVQLDLLENTFYEYTKISLKGNKLGSVNGYGDTPKNIREKLDVFSVNSTLAVTAGSITVPSNMYRLINLNISGQYADFQEVSKQELNYIAASPLTKPTIKYPIYYRQGDTIKIMPTSITSVSCDFIKIPDDPIWAYTTGTFGQYIYNSGSSVNFTLHPSEEVDLVIGILAYAGIAIKDPEVVQAATGEKSNKYTQENS
jgi:hypothetical protein